jgi:endonuclease/exonuclease/phosphatase family metal-dependent hydrolase
MKVASFNVENLFSRPRAMNKDSWAEGRPILEDYAKLNTILQKQQYSEADKTEIVELVGSLGLKSDDMGKYAVLRQNRGQLLKRKRDGSIEIVAAGRDEWIGWVELRRESLNEKAILNTAAVIRDVNADVIGIVEAEDRISLKEFNDTVIKSEKGIPYEQVMLIDGNDSRGIDVGLMARGEYKIGLMRSHVHDLHDSVVVFSRDCPEYQITTPTGECIWVLVNHLKSKGFGSQQSSDARRRLQATAIKEIYSGLIARGEKNVVILGDFNDTPDSESLQPLLEDTDLKDVSAHPNFDDGGFRGTYGGATASNKIDYVLLSPTLFARVGSGGIFRKGAWPGVRPKKWEVYPSIIEKYHAASDHQAIWAEIDI